MEPGRESRGKPNRLKSEDTADDQTYHFKHMLKAAGHDQKVIKLKVKDAELEEHKASYETAVGKLRQIYSKDE